MSVSMHSRRRRPRRRWGCSRTPRAGAAARRAGRGAGAHGRQRGRGRATARHGRARYGRGSGRDGSCNAASAGEV